MATSVGSGVQLSAQEFDALFERVSNWGRWGPEDERGALNYVTPERTRTAAALVRSGRTVTLSRPLHKVAGPDNPKPVLHYMSMMADVEIGAPQPRFFCDFVSVEFHGNSESHIDALCHCVYRGKMFNGALPERVDSTGSGVHPITVAEHGVVSRGVLLDMPRLRGQKWLDKEVVLGVEDLEAAEAAQGVRVGEGDILVIRVGQTLRRLELGTKPPSDGAAGIHPNVMPWIHERRVAVLGADADNDPIPSQVDGVSHPIHVLGMVAMGMPFLDNLNLEDLSAACAAENRWEFQCVLAPLRLERGTGSPLNPIAIF
jgi:kynurenine formamidase